jgi:hypothetical protein
MNNLFVNLAKRFKAQNLEAKAKESIMPTTVKPAKPAEPAAPPYIVHTVVPVKTGFAMPLGEVIRDPFALTVEAGVRWHPEWKEPRITVNVWRILPMGDALGWSGEKVLMFASLLDPNVVALIKFHGQPVTEESSKLLAKMGVAAPKVQQTLSTFYSFRTNRN